MQYQTEHILNLITGAPLIFEVDPVSLSDFRAQMFNVKGVNKIQTTRSILILARFECSLLPSRLQVEEIWIENGYSDELMMSILHDFGMPDSFIRKLLVDCDFVGALRPNFAGVKNDPFISSSVILSVYKKLQEYFTEAC